MTAKDVIQALQLAPHPEGGWYREIYRSSDRVQRGGETRSATTAIYYLLERQQLSRWHVVDVDEIWHFYGGAPLELVAYDPASRKLERQTLQATGTEARPVGIIPSGGLAGGAQPWRVLAGRLHCQPRIRVLGISLHCGPARPSSSLRR